MLNQWQVSFRPATFYQRRKNGKERTLYNVNENSLPPKNDFKVVDDKERKVGLLNA